jgi:hypothetical protein
MKEEFFKKLSIISLFGIGVFLIASLINFFAPSAALDIISAIGFCLFLLPMFSLTFALPAGLAIEGGEKEGGELVPFWGKVGLFSLFYLFLFPIVTVLMVITVDSIFHFLPNFYEAMALGADRLVVREIRAEAKSLSYIIGGITYGTMVLAGLIYRVAKAKKAEA